MSPESVAYIFAADSVGISSQIQESYAISKKPCDAAAVRCGLKFADIQYKFKEQPSYERHDSEL